MKVLACYSMKGGVGKTATAVNLAWLAAQAGIKTLLIDLDPQGASSFYFRVNSKKKAWDNLFFKDHEYLLKHIKSTEFECLDVLPAHFSFRNFDINLSQLKKPEKGLSKVLKGFKKEYELVILDCPPAISYLAESVFQSSDMILVPVIPTTLSERTLVQLYQYFKQHEQDAAKIYPFFSMVQKQKLMHTDTMQRLTQDNKQVLKTVIPFSTDIEKMGEHTAALGEFGRGKPVFIACKDLWYEVRDILFP